MEQLWYTERMGVTEVLASLRAIAKAHGVRVRVTRSASGAFWIPRTRTIKLGAECFISIQALASCFFHELAHSMNYDQRKYWTYHSRSTKSARKHKRTALKAERFTDKIGAQTLSCYFPDIPYIHLYEGKGSKDFLYLHYGWNDRAA